MSDLDRAIEAAAVTLRSRLEPYSTIAIRTMSMYHYQDLARIAIEAAAPHLNPHLNDFVAVTGHWKERAEKAEAEVERLGGTCRWFAKRATPEEATHIGDSRCDTCGHPIALHNDHCGYQALADRLVEAGPPQRQCNALCADLEADRDLWQKRAEKAEAEMGWLRDACRWFATTRAALAAYDEEARRVPHQ